MKTTQELRTAAYSNLIKIMTIPWNAMPELQIQKITHVLSVQRKATSGFKFSIAKVMWTRKYHSP